MEVSQFDYALPKGLIAQSPAEPRDSSRLMAVGGTVRHLQFRDLPSFLREGDLLVSNDARVVKARFEGRKTSGGKVTGLFIGEEDGKWDVQLGGKNLSAGSVVKVGGDEFLILKRCGEGRYLVDSHGTSPADFMARNGSMPLPPYIKGYAGPESSYQTVYSRNDGAVAAPTAGLHFTPTLMENLAEAGVSMVSLNLTVGPGTFSPVRSVSVEGHKMEGEAFDIPHETALALEQAAGEGRRVIAVGTTTVRAIESALAPENSGPGRCEECSCPPGKRLARSGVARSFIYPGYSFRYPYAGMITNFHLPKSTLVMLVSAYAGRERILSAYAEAVSQKYRFYSFGDAMFLDMPPESVEAWK